METEIEELRETLYEAGELIEKLKALPGSEVDQESNEILAKIKALLPEPEPFEAWANFYAGWVPCIYRTLEYAKTNAGPGATRTAVHIREVTPAPKWIKWRAVKLDVNCHWPSLSITCDNEVEAADIAAAHNTEMKRVTGTEGK